MKENRENSFMKIFCFHQKDNLIRNIDRMGIKSGNDIFF